MAKAKGSSSAQKTKVSFGARKKGKAKKLKGKHDRKVSPYRGQGRSH